MLRIDATPCIALLLTFGLTASACSDGEGDTDEDSSFTCVQLGALVATSDGVVRGVVSESGQTRAFYQIPYAQDPVGALRWQPRWWRVSHTSATLTQ